MKKFSVKLTVYKYSRLKWVEYEIFEAENKEIAKKIAKDFTVSTKWALDLTPIPDLRTLKEKIY
ncbi:MAG: hypothetical protein LBP63_10080 [Prevotellaceae bacterium]|jgi:hypothetical protein|nr:hypothetical protein [Prevotellaceae bacterium]